MTRLTSTPRSLLAPPPTSSRRRIPTTSPRRCARRSTIQSTSLAGHAVGEPRAAGIAAGRPGRPGGLTRRELEILRLVAEGHSNSQLARMLWVTEQTVKFHLSNIYRKLGVANRTEASRWAQVNGLLDDELSLA